MVATPNLDIALYNYLRDLASLAALIEGKVYPLMAPQQATMPYVIYTEVGLSTYRHMAGLSNIATAFYQLDAYGQNHLSAALVADALRVGLDDLQKVALSHIDVRKVILSDRRWMLEETYDGSQTNDYRCSTDFTIWYRPIPV